MATCEEKVTLAYQKEVSAIEADAQEGVNKLLEAYSPNTRLQAQMNGFTELGANLNPKIIGKRPFGSKFAEYLQGVHTYLVNSDSMAVRGVASELFEAPQGGTSLKETASIDSFVFQQNMRAATRGRFGEGLEDYAAELGYTGLRREKQMLNTKFVNDFKKMVYLETKKPNSYSSEAVKKAAQGYRDLYAKGLEIRKASGESGFQNVANDPNYTPTIYNNANIHNAVAKSGRSNVVNAIARAYELGGDGTFKLNRDSAVAIAEATVERNLNRNLTMGDAMRTLTNTDLDKVMEDLRKAGLSEEDIEAFLNTSTARETNKNMSARARRSFNPDVSVSHNGVKMVDLLETDVEKLGEMYTRDAAGSAAMAKHGFANYADAKFFLADLEKTLINQGMTVKQANKEVGMLNRGIDLIYGKSVDEGNREFLQGVSTLREITSLVRLSSNGMASFPEMARATVNRGLGSTMEAVPSIRELIAGSKHLRGGKLSGKYDDPFYDMVDTVMGYAGDDYALDFRGIAADNLEEIGDSKLTGLMQTALAKGQRLQSFTSGFRAIQGGGEKLSARAMMRRYVQDVSGNTNKNFSKLEIAEAGWGDDGFYDSLLAYGQRNLKEVEHGGRAIEVVDFSNMPPDMFHRMQVGMYRTMKREMQGQFVGDTSIAMNTWLGKLLSQFRTFSIASFEKQLLRDLNHAPAQGFQMFMVSSGLAAVAHTAGVVTNSVGRTDRSQYIERNMSGANFTFGVVNRSGQLASVGIGADVLATFGLIPDELMASPSSIGYRGLSGSSVPVLGLVGDVKDTVKKTGELLSGDITPSKYVNQVQKIAPFGKTFGVNQGLNALESALEDN